MKNIFNIYDYWVDGEGKLHKISQMDTQYIHNCLDQLKKMLNRWRGIIPENLTDDELKKKDEVGQKAWFVLNGIPYIDAFCSELKKRKES